jgi:glycosyltransferase involved in cell wall biosynthesis
MIDGHRPAIAERAMLAVTPFDADPARVRRYRRSLAAHRPDIVFATYDLDSSLVWACCWAGVPVVVCVQIYWPFCPLGTLYLHGQGPCSGPSLGKCVSHIARDPLSPNLALSFRQLPGPFATVVYAKFLSRHSLLSKASAFAAVSEGVRQRLETAGLGPVRTIHNSVDPDRFAYHPLESGPPLVLFPSARPGAERKGFAHFRSVARDLHPRFPEASFVALNYPGDAVVSGTPYLDHEALARLLSRTTLVVVPALWDEPFGLTLIEAGAAGRPVVAYEGGAVREILEDGRTGIIVPRGDLEALSRAVERLLSDRSLAARMGEEARRRIEARFSYRSMAQQYFRWAEEILYGRPESSAPSR